jgi:hypothetical protein
MLEAMRQINEGWLHGRIEDLAPLLHPEIVMVYPGFAGRGQGREKVLAGFREFVQNAVVHDFQTHDDQTDIAGDTAVSSFRYEMIYELAGKRYRSTGRDVWVFQGDGASWTAVWRTMLDVQENEA